MPDYGRPTGVTEPFVAWDVTPPGSFTAGAEGPACDRDGYVYAVGFGRDDTIGCIAPGGAAEPFVQLPAGSIGNGIRVRRDSAALFVADYTGHNILVVGLPSGDVEVWAHEPTLHQPNDLAITADDVLYASDPNWEEGTGRVWRIGPDRRFRLVADGMGTTNGIEVSPDGTRLYVNESVQRRIVEFDIDADGGLRDGRLLAEFRDFGLDGMRCDARGHLWVARYGKGVVAEVTPTGEVVREVAVRGDNCTNVTLTPDGRICLVTSADVGNLQAFLLKSATYLTS